MENLEKLSSGREVARYDQVFLDFVVFWGLGGGGGGS